MSVFGGYDDLLRACRTVLDGAAVARLLNPSVVVRGDLQGTVTDVQVQRLWPYRDAGIVVEWSFLLDSTRRYSLFGVVAEARPEEPSADATAERTFTSHVVNHRLQGVDIRVPDMCLRIFSPDCDPGLPHVRHCLDRNEMCGAMRGVSALRRAGADMRDVSSTALLGYRFGRRAAIAYDLRMSDGRTRRVIGKTFRDDRGRTMLDRLARLRIALSNATSDAVTVPEPIGYLPDYRMALCAAVSEEDGNDPVADETPLPMIIEALSALHRVDMVGLPFFEVADEMGIISRWERLVRRLRPVPSSAFLRLVTGLPELAKRITRKKVCVVHRDFYSAQLIFGRRTCAIVDLDTMAVGDPTIDLGNLIAHTMLRELERGSATCQIRELKHAITHAYQQQNDSIDQASLNFYLMTSLCRLGAVHAFRSATGRFAEPLWQAGASLFEAGKKRCPTGRTPSASVRTAPGKVMTQEVAP